MILLWGIAADDPLARVRQALIERAAPFTFIDQQAVLETEIDITLGRSLRGRLRAPSWSVDLDSVTAVYVRPYDVRRMSALADLKPESQAFQRAVGFEDAMTCWI